MNPQLAHVIAEYLTFIEIGAAAAILTLIWSVVVGCVLLHRTRRLLAIPPPPPPGWPAQPSPGRHGAPWA